MPSFCESSPTFWQIHNLQPCNAHLPKLLPIYSPCSMQPRTVCKSARWSGSELFSSSCCSYIKYGLSAGFRLALLCVSLAGRSVEHFLNASPSQCCITERALATLQLWARCGWALGPAKRVVQWFRSFGLTDHHTRLKRPNSPQRQP